jgi:hypothetical protein
MDIEARFRAKYEVVGGCWMWRGARNLDGYGVFMTPTKSAGRRQKQWGAHRFSWELHRGPVPAGLCVMHRCDADRPPGDRAYRLCVNPEHLFLGTNADNMADMARKGRAASGDRHGHRTKPHRTARGERNGMHTHPECVKRGEANAAAKLTADAVRSIRSRWEAGESQPSIAERLGVSLDTVHRVIRRLTWRHVE